MAEYRIKVETKKSGEIRYFPQILVDQEYDLWFDISDERNGYAMEYDAKVQISAHKDSAVVRTTYIKM